jgi:hypothetical protein
MKRFFLVMLQRFAKKCRNSVRNIDFVLLIFFGSMKIVHIFVLYFDK